MQSISHDTIRTQTGRILSSREFNSSNRLSQFLHYVVEKTLNGQQEDIKQYTVAVEGLGYDEGFDPISNPIVRIQAGKLRRALEHYYSIHGTNDPIRIQIPKGKYVPEFLDNKTAKEPADSSDSHSATSRETPHKVSNPTIAVIMFGSLNAENTYDHIATGLTEEIIIALTRFPDHKVIGPLSRNIIHQQGLDTRTIGHKYGVRFILDGTVRKNGQTFRLTVRLTDALNGQQLWGEVLDCSLQNGSIMEFENNLVGRVVASVADSYGSISRLNTKESFARQSHNTTSYEAVLYFYHYIKEFTPESYGNALDSMKKAVQNDPDNALCAAMLADLLISSYFFGISDDESIWLRAERLTEKALALDPNCQAAHFVKALIHYKRFERSLFLVELENTLKLNPNNAVYTAALAMHVGWVGEWQFAMHLIDKAISLNPHYPGWYHIVPYMNHYHQGEYDQAYYEAKEFNTRGFFWDPLIRAAALGQGGRKAEAKKAIEELQALEPDFRTRGKILIQRLAYLDEHVDMLWDGLRKAGL